MLYSATTVFMPELSLVEQAKILSKYGYDGIELRVRRCSDEARKAAVPSNWGYHVNDIDPENFKKKAPEVRKVLKDYNLKLAGIAANVACTDLEQFKHLLEGAVKAKAPWIRLGASQGFGPDSNYYAILGATIEGFAKCLELSHGTGVKLIVEMHGNTIHPSASLAMRIVEHFSHEDVGVNYDPQNMVKDGYETPELAFQILGPYLAHCHFGSWKPVFDKIDENGTALWKWQQTKMGEGFFDYPRVMKLLKKYAYKGFISVEDFNPNRTVADKLKDSIKYLRKIEALA